jgi:hypothetical protein
MRVNVDIAKMDSAVDGRMKHQESARLDLDQDSTQLERAGQKGKSSGLTVF